MNICLENVSAGYEKDNFILNDISVSFTGGGIWGILGPNGSGKTTLLRVLSGILPYNGHVKLEAEKSKELSSLSKRELARYIAMMPQFTSVYFSYSVYETIKLGRYSHSGNSLGEMLGRMSTHDLDVVDKAIETTGLTDMKDCRLSSLSGGQLQRVMLARTIAQETPVILLDEPTNHLDLKHHTELISYLREWSKLTTEVAGKTHPNTVISVFHDIGTAAILAENILLLKDGAIVKKGPAEEILTRDLLKDIYDTDVVDYYKEIMRRMNLIS